MKVIFSRFSVAILIAMQVLWARDAGANVQCGLGVIQSLAIGNDHDFSSVEDLWLKIVMDGINISAGSEQYPETDTIKLRTVSDKNLFQRQMMILVTAFIKSTPVRIISDKTMAPACEGTADDFQIVTCEDLYCGTVPVQ